MPLNKLYITFRGIFPRSFITKCRRKLEKIDFIKIYAYNPADPSGPCKHIVLTGSGVWFYNSFVDVLRGYILSPMEDADPDWPSIILKTVSEGHILRFTNLE